MGMIAKNSLILATCAAAAMMVSGCPGGKGIPGGGKVPGGMGGGGGVDANACGGYAASEAGRKLKAFLQATADLDAKLGDIVAELKTSCVAMGGELKLSGLDGDAKAVCGKVFATVDANLKAGFKGSARLKIDYKPAVCTVDVSASAKAAAECEGKAEADIKVKCEGSCSGTCNGSCSGKCAGKAGSGGSGGSCNGKCEGTCSGSCSGGCSGSADVEASAQCKASAEVKASMDVQCTEPELDISFDAKVVVDKPKVEATVAAFKVGLPKILKVKARLKPLQGAVKTYVKTAAELTGAAKDIASAFKDQALCITGQLTAMASAATRIEANVSVSVEVSASASASAGAK